MSSISPSNEGADFRLFVFNAFKKKNRKKQKTKMAKRTLPSPGKNARVGIRALSAVQRFPGPGGGFRGDIYIHIYMHTKLYICMCTCTNIWAKQIQAEYVYIYISQLGLLSPSVLHRPLPQAVHVRSAERLHFLLASSCNTPAELTHSRSRLEFGQLGLIGSALGPPGFRLCASGRRFLPPPGL